MGLRPIAKMSIMVQPSGSAINGQPGFDKSLAAHLMPDTRYLDGTLHDERAVIGVMVMDTELAIGFLTNNQDAHFPVRVLADPLHDIFKQAISGAVSWLLPANTPKAQATRFLL